MNFEGLLKIGVSGTTNTPLVHLGNIEVEQHWCRSVGALQLPTLTAASARTLVNRIEQVALFLAGSEDYLVLKEPLDSEYAAYLRDQGFQLPKVIALSKNQPHLNITENLLADEPALLELTALAREGAMLMPFGVSHLEEELARRTGLPLATPSAPIAEAVNSKIYSRRLNEALELRAIPGSCASSMEELGVALEEHSHVFAAGSKLVVKEAFGVSGKGLMVLDSPEKGKSLLKMWDRQAAKSRTPMVRVVVEHWIPKIMDFNYQFLIGKKGEVNYVGVRDAITDNGVHMGHRLPTTLTAAQEDELRVASQKLGTAMYRDGYFGLVGVDGILATDGTLYPNLEINARFNMSTYQNRISEELMGNGRAGLAKHYSLKLAKRQSFFELSSRLGEQLYDRKRGTGFLITNFSTLNAAEGSSTGSWPARLYGILIAESVEAIVTRDNEIKGHLAQLERENT